MSRYDQFFKKLFETFFADLLRLGAPELLAKFSLERVQFRLRRKVFRIDPGRGGGVRRFANAGCQGGERDAIDVV